MEKGKLYVLAGPSGVGKGTVIKALKASYQGFWVSVSATTREKRPGEESGVDYYYLRESEFDQLLAEDAFLEWAVVHGQHRYGTLEHTVQEHLDAGETVLLEIDLAGARQVRKKRPDAHFVFLRPPREEDLVARLSQRGTESQAERERRLLTAKTEMRCANEFDQVVINDKVARAARELAEIMGIA